MATKRKVDPRLRRTRSRPSFPAPSGQVDPGFAAVLELLEGPISAWSPRDLTGWLQEHLIGPGLMKRPTALREPGASPLPLDPRVDADPAAVQEILARARQRALEALRGLVAPVPDDRFLHAAIYGGRVRRASIEGKASWIASPREIDFFGDMVLSLLAAAVLADREHYRAHLGFCELCGRVTFKDPSDSRPQCAEHRISGLTSKSTLGR